MYPVIPSHTHLQRHHTTHRHQSSHAGQRQPTHFLTASARTHLVDATTSCNKEPQRSCKKLRNLHRGRPERKLHHCNASPSVQGTLCCGEQRVHLCPVRQGLQLICRTSQREGRGATQQITKREGRGGEACAYVQGQHTHRIDRDLLRDGQHQAPLVCHWMLGLGLEPWVGPRAPCASRRAWHPACHRPGHRAWHQHHRCHGCRRPPRW